MFLQNADKVKMQDTTFDGITYNATEDKHRLFAQLQSVFSIMKDSNWRTLEEIRQRIDASEASISARLRDFRKVKFGKHVVNKRSIGNRSRGLFEYQLLINPDGICKETGLCIVNGREVGKSAIEILASQINALPVEDKKKLLSLI